jgi:hypothetical protein
MTPRPLSIERPLKTLIVERRDRRKFEVAHSQARQLVINRFGLPGQKGEVGGVQNPDDILDYIASFDGSLT